MNTMNKFGITKEAMLELAAEEATELAQACLKLARILRDENPTPVTKDEAVEHLMEEMADNGICRDSLYDVLGEIGVAYPACDIHEITIAKRNRWNDRVREHMKASDVKPKTDTNKGVQYYTYNRSDGTLYDKIIHKYIQKEDLEKYPLSVVMKNLNEHKNCQHASFWINDIHYDVKIIETIGEATNEYYKELYPDELVENIPIRHFVYNSSDDVLFDADNMILSRDKRVLMTVRCHCKMSDRPRLVKCRLGDFEYHIHIK